MAKCLSSMIRLIRVCILVLLPVVFLSCSRTRPPDVTGVIFPFKIERFDQDLFRAAGGFPASLQFLKNTYGGFFRIYCSGVLNIPYDDADSVLARRLSLFVLDRDVMSLYEASQKAFPSLKGLEDSLHEAFRYYAYYFPENEVPRVISMLSWFNFAQAATDSVLAIGLDMYLGSNSKYYPTLSFPLYKTRKMRREYILPDCIRGWIQTEYETKATDFLGQMLYAGKVLYACDAILPDLADSLKTGFTSRQLAFCEQNEASIWGFFIDKKLLYSTNYQEFDRYLNDGPGARGFPEGAPSDIGRWIGWQIVKQYMEKFPDTRLPDLMTLDNSQEFLQRSEYKPKR